MRLELDESSFYYRVTRTLLITRTKKWSIFPKFSPNLHTNPTTINLRFINHPARFRGRKSRRFSWEIARLFQCRKFSPRPSANQSAAAHRLRVTSRELSTSFTDAAVWSIDRVGFVGHLAFGVLGRSTLLKQKAWFLGVGQKSEVSVVCR